MESERENDQETKPIMMIMRNADEFVCRVECNNSTMKRHTHRYQPLTERRWRRWRRLRQKTIGIGYGWTVRTLLEFLFIQNLTCLLGRSSFFFFRFSSPFDLQFWLCWSFLSSFRNYLSELLIFQIKFHSSCVLVFFFILFMMLAGCRWCYCRRRRRRSNL